VFHVGVLSSVVFTIFGLGGSVSVSDHSLLGELFDDSKKISLLISTFSGGLVRDSERFTHSLGGGEHISVSGDFLGGSGHDDTFLKDASVHVIDVTRESGFEGSKLSKGLLKVSGNAVELFLESGFDGLKLIEVNSDGTDHLLHHGSDSVDGRLVNKEIFLRSGHLGEKLDDWGVGVHDVDHGTGLDEVHGVGGELDERSFLSDEIIEETEGTLDDRSSTSVLGDSLVVKGVTFLSSGGSGSKRSSGVSEVLDGVSEIDFGLISGLSAGGEVVGGSSKSSFTLRDFSVSEVLLFGARGGVSGKHSVVLSLFFSDLVFELVEESFDVTESTTGFDLSLDLSEEVSERVALERVELHVVHLE